VERAVVGPRARASWVVLVGCLLGAGLGCSVMGTAGDAAPDLPGVSETGGAGLSGGEAGIPFELGEEPQGMVALGTDERLVLAYGGTTMARWARLDDERSVGGGVVEWPEMLYLGEEGQVGDVWVRPTEIRVVRGSSVPMAYSPEGDEMVRASDGSPKGIRGHRNRPVLVVPPNASLVMVRIETSPSVGTWTGPGDYVCPANDATEYGYDPGSFRLAYPSLGETPVQLSWGDWWFGEYQPVGHECPGIGWLYFVVATMDVDPGLAWLEYARSGMPGDLGFWTLTARP